MKFLEYPSLADVEMQLSGVELGDCVLNAKLEAYSCKLAGIDKKITKNLERRFSDELARSPNSPTYLSQSPVGPLTDSNSRRTLFNLICTLNAAYPDYDFSNLEIESLVREQRMESVVRTVDSHLEQAYQASGYALRAALWNAIDDVIAPDECELYSYVSGGHCDLLEDEASIWSTHLFFYNKRQRKVLLMALSARNRSSMADDSSSSSDEVGAELYDSSLDTAWPAMAY